MKGHPFLHFRVPWDLLRWTEIQAKKAGLTLSEFMRRLILKEKAREEVACIEGKSHEQKE
jgi:hypothetical protein